MTLKMLQLIRNCGECPNYGYYSGGAYECSLVNQVVRDKSRIASFCPLADFPSQKLADQAATIDAMREPYQHSFCITTIMHVAHKLKVDMHANRCGITIPFKDGATDREVYLCADYITKLEAYPGCVIEFIAADNKKYKLFPDAKPPELHEATRNPLDANDELWRRYDLTS